MALICPKWVINSSVIPYRRNNPETHRWKDFPAAAPPRNGSWKAGASTNRKTTTGRLLAPELSRRRKASTRIHGLAILLTCRRQGVARDRGLRGQQQDRRPRCAVARLGQPRR